MMLCYDVGCWLMMLRQFFTRTRSSVLLQDSDSLFWAHNLSIGSQRIHYQSCVPPISISTQCKIIIIKMHQPAQYCSKCASPFKEMGACPNPNASLIYAYLSLLPYILAILLFLVTIITRKDSHIKLSALVLSLYVFSDKIVKKLLRNPRPPYSCKSSFGMPSSHMVVISVLGFTRIKSKNSSILQKILWIALILSQGMARIQLNYHTLEQVIAGALVAAIYSLIFQRIWDSTWKHLQNTKLVQLLVNKEEAESKKEL